MNLYGWSLSAFKEALASKSTAVLRKATALVEETLTTEPAISRAKAWLCTLIVSGFPLRQDRTLSAGPADGGLLTVQMETEFHAFAIYCLVRAIARDEWLDLSAESSSWKHPAVVELYQELRASGFTRSKGCSIQALTCMASLIDGSPLFGDSFRTDWSFYTIFSNQELAAMIPVLQAAVGFRRPLPEGYPEELIKNAITGLSEDGKKFVADLVKWFCRIQQAGQDAFIFWW